MYQGKHYRNSKTVRHNRQHSQVLSLKKTRIAIIGVVFALLLCVVVNETISYMQHDGSVENTFKIAVLDSQIDESFQHNVKEDVSVTNNSDIPVYVRAAFVFQWKDSSGFVLSGTPEENVDYELDLLLTPDGWFKGTDGYYYYRNPVEPGYSTSVLIDRCTIKNPVSPERSMSLDIVAQVIQTTPSAAVEEAWGMQIESNGKLFEP